MVLTSACRALFVLFATAALLVSGVVATPAPAAHASVVVSDWAALKAEFAAGGTKTVALGADITGPVIEGLALASGDDVVLDLNDHGLVVGDADDRTRKYGAGIAVPQGAVLTIQGGPGRTGALSVFGGWYSAGIGGTDLPVDESELVPEADGDVVATGDGRTATVTLPSSLHNQWLYAYGHSTPVGLGWFRAPTGTLTVPLEALTPGDHRLALLSIDGALAGWAPITVAALPSTGASTSPAVLLGAGAIALGGLLLAARRLRRS